MNHHKSEPIERGRLFIVPTPIGNLKDITLRALEVLSNVDLIACEDSRHTIKLLNHYTIKKPLLSYEKFSERSRTDLIIDKLLSGKDIALVSDAGTPLISDPGATLAEAARANGIDIIALPGACAFITALSASGFSGNFRFIGFFPRNTKDALDEIQKIGSSDDITIFYDSPRRVVSTLEKLNEHLGHALICIGRELTKLHEEYITGDISNVISKLKGDHARGEMTVLVKTLPIKADELPDIAVRARELIGKGYSKRDTAKILQDLYKIPKKDIYSMLFKEIL